MKKSKITGIVCTAVLHLLAVALLFLLTLSVPEEQEEGGVPVMLGDAVSGGGGEEAYTLTEVDVEPLPETPAEEVVAEEPMISQEEESPMQVEKQPAREGETSPVVPKAEAVEKPEEKSEAEKRAEAERIAAEAAASKIAGAFGKGSKMETAGEGGGPDSQGSATGNSSEGKSSGVGGIGVYDLQGRSLGTGSLPVPVYNVQDEGRVVVTIVVNPAGRVIRASINKRTNTVNPALRKAALEAAQKARFNEIAGVDNQSGTITYYFKLK